jgi:hypothetical protein
VRSSVELRSTKIASFIFYFVENSPNFVAPDFYCKKVCQNKCLPLKRWPPLLEIELLARRHFQRLITNLGFKKKMSLLVASAT